MNASLKTALGLSAVIHSAMFAPVFTRAANRPVPVMQQIVVDYVNLKELKTNTATAREILPKSADTSGIGMMKRVESAASRESAEKEKAAKKEARELSRKQAPLRGTKGYINYYQLIREKIRQRLKDHYREYNTQGDVSLIFMLNGNGSLAAIDAEEGTSVNDEALIRVAISSVREAAPFPPFPKELAVPKMTFDLTVTFKRD